MPISDNFRKRLYPNLDAIAAHFGTPFHLYDEIGIRQTVQNLYAAFYSVCRRLRLYVVPAHVINFTWDLSLPFIWLGFPILSTMAVNKVLSFYDEDSKILGIELKERTWGPSYKETKKIFQLTKDEFIKQRAKESIRLWRLSYYCLYAFKSLIY